MAAVMTDMSDTIDIAIVGGGPTGLFGAFYAGLRQMSVKIIDSLDVLGGQLATLYPEKYIFDVAGFPNVLAKDLVRDLVAQAMVYRPVVCLGEQVRTLDFDPQSAIYQIRTSRGVHGVRSILIAAGVGSFAPKKLPVSAAEKYEGRGLHYFVSNPESFCEKKLLIVGGGDSAVDWANALWPIASQVTLIHRRDRFRAHENSVRKLDESSVDVRVFYELKSIEGDGRIERAVIYDNRSHEEQTIEVDAVLVNVGFESSLGPLKDWELEIEGGQIKVDSMMQTNRPGIYAAGDICTFPGKLKLIATGFGEACTAVNFAKHYLDPKANIFPGHSTNMRR